MLTVSKSSHWLDACYLFSFGRHKNIGCFDIQDRGDCLQIWNLMIDQSYRGQGYGQKMMRDMIKKLGKHVLWLQVHKDNLPARAIYEKAGFEYILGPYSGDYLPMMRFP